MTGRSLVTWFAVVILVSVLGVSLLYALRSWTLAPSTSAPPVAPTQTLSSREPTSVLAATATPAPTPAGFVLPQGCSYVGSPAVQNPGPITNWGFNCGSVPDLNAVERLRPAFAQQGWTLCKAGQGRGFWAKGTVQTIVSQSAAGYPLLSQISRQPDDCP